MTDTLSPAPNAGPTAPVSAVRRPAHRSARWRLVVCLTIVVGALGWVALRGLTGSFVYYLTPTDIAVGQKAQVDQRVRLGGYVVPGSVHRPADRLTFTVTDGETRMEVLSTGPVPQMFRAGQGVVLEGSLGRDGRFHSDTLLVKHDGEYRAPTDALPSGGGS
jgi:cytochrome c-type biogenesis protein CcmE